MIPIQIKKVPNLSAVITIGTQLGYTDDCYSKTQLINILQMFQKEQIQRKKVYLSACISECTIVLNGQVEPHYKLSFINYPKFPLSEKRFKTTIETLVAYLMKHLKQNRIVVVYHNETIMFEKQKDIDPRI